MAIVTTMAAGPLLSTFIEEQRSNRVYRVLVVVDDPPAQWDDVALAGAMVGARRPAEVVLSRLLPYRMPALQLGIGLSGDLLEMTKSMTELERLAGRVRRDHVEVPVLSRFTDDVERDLLAQISAATPESVVVHAGRQALAEIRAAVTGRLLIVGSGPAQPPAAIAVRWGNCVNATAALEVATALAIARELPLVIVGGKKRARATAARLARYGVAASAGVAPGNALLVAADEGGDVPPDGVRVAVRAQVAAGQRDLGDWLPEFGLSVRPVVEAAG